MQVTTNEQINPLILDNERIHQTKNCWEWSNLYHYSSKRFGRVISRKRFMLTLYVSLVRDFFPDFVFLEFSIFYGFTLINIRRYLVIR